MLLSAEDIRRKVEALGPWFHNIDLRGVATAPGLDFEFHFDMGIRGIHCE